MESAVAVRATFRFCPGSPNGPTRTADVWGAGGRCGIDLTLAIGIYTVETKHAHRIAPRSPASVFKKERVLVTKKEIVKTISEELGLTQLRTKEIVQKTFDAIVDTLVEEKRIELRNFGVFEVKKRAPRKARNPRTGEKVYVSEKYVVTFKPGKEMEERVRRMIEAKAGTQASVSDFADDNGDLSDADDIETVTAGTTSFGQNSNDSQS